GSDRSRAAAIASVPAGTRTCVTVPEARVTSNEPGTSWAGPGRVAAGVASAAAGTSGRSAPPGRVTSRTARRVTRIAWRGARGRAEGPVTPCSVPALAGSSLSVRLELGHLGDEVLDRPAIRPLEGPRHGPPLEESDLATQHVVDPARLRGGRRGQV